MCRYLAQQLHGLMNRWTTDTHGSHYCAYVHACNLVKRFCSFCKSHYMKPKHLIISRQSNMMHLVYCNSQTLHSINKITYHGITFTIMHCVDC